MKRRVIFLIALAFLLLLVFWITPPLGGIRARVQKVHGVRVPLAATHIQTCYSGGILALQPFDKGALCMFELPTNALPNFLAQLTVQATRLPESTSGDPCVNGWNVWPKSSKTFVPGDTALHCLKKTWRGDAKPIRMLSCASSTGDWLHVEIWEVADHLVIKLYTDWN